MPFRVNRLLQVLLGLILFTSPALSFETEKVGTLEFIDKPLEEILLVIASYANVSLMPDETVTGTASFYFPGGSAEEALELFLGRNKLFLNRDDNLSIVSRVSLTAGDDGILILKTGGISLDQLFRIIGEKLDITILHDPLTGEKYDLHLAGKDPGDLLSVIISPLTGWQVSRNGDVYYIAGPGRDLPGIFSFPGFFTIFLKNITGSELRDSLPPGIEPGALELTISPHMVYLRGGEESHKLLRSQLEFLDIPKPQIRYDILIFSFLEGSGVEWGSEFSTSFPPEGGNTAFLAGLGNALTMNFDFFSTFGYQFVYSMDLALKESRLRILADTTLRGLSGEDVCFFNSGTSRFRDEGNEDSSPEILDVSSGTFIEIRGELDGAGKIIMDVKASQSDLSPGDEVMSELPSSRERGFETIVRTEPGVPVVVGGFRQEKKRADIKKVPLLGDIPLLGFLFQHKETVTEELKTVIYIVPHIEHPPWEPRKSRIYEYIEKYGGLF